MAVAMLRSWLVVTVLSASAVTLAQQQPTQASQPDSGKKQPCALSGLVVNTTGSTAIRKAIVRISKDQPGLDNEPQTATTDAEGRFTFTDLAPGRYELTTSHPSFVSLSTRRGVGSGLPQGVLIYSLTPGQQIKDIVIKLTPGAALRGHVTDEDGDPVAHAQVQLLAAVGQSSGKRAAGRAAMRIGGNATSDDQGDFRIFSVAPGRYYLRVAPPGDFSQLAAGPQKSEERAYVPTFYPSTTRRETATVVDMRSADELSLNVALQKGSLYPVTGTLSGAKGPVPAGMVVASQGGSFSSTAQIKEGKFGLRLPPGRYTLAALAMDDDFSLENMMPMRAHKVIDVTQEGVHDLALVLDGGKGSTAIAGRVRAENGALPASVRVFVAIQRMDVEEGSRDEDFEDFAVEGAFFSATGNIGGFAQAKPDGTFEIKTVAPGTYEVAVGAMLDKLDGWYTKSIQAGGREVLNSGLTASGGSLTMDIVLSSASASLQGSVSDRDEHPAANVLVVLIPNPGRARRHSLYQTATTDQNGRFELRGLEPGEYTVYSWDDIEDGAWFDDEVLKGYSNDGVKVTLRAGEKTQTQVHVAASQQGPAAQ